MTIDPAPRHASLSVERMPFLDMEAWMSPAPWTSIALHLSGRCTLEWATGARPLVARPARGQVTIVPQGRSGLLRVRGGPCEVLKIGLPNAMFARWAERDERLWTGNPIVDRFSVGDPLIQQIGLTLLAETERPGTIDTLYRDALSNALIAHLVRRHSEADPATPAERRVHPLSQARARRAVAFMEDRLAQAIGLDDIARELGLSTSHFAAQFRAAFGRSPARYLTWLRLERARAMLEAGSPSVAEVARTVGFNSTSHFAQAFRTEFGVPPSRFRAR